MIQEWVFKKANYLDDARDRSCIPPSIKPIAVHLFLADLLLASEHGWHRCCCRDTILRPTPCHHHHQLFIVPHVKELDKCFRTLSNRRSITVTFVTPLFNTPGTLIEIAMSYRTYGGEPDISSSGAPSPYTPRIDQPFLLSPEYDRVESPGYRYSPLRKPVPAAASTIESQPPPVKKPSVVRRRWDTKDYWYVPTSMVGVFVLGCFGAFGHHHLYSSLDGAATHNQLMFVRYGTAIAFFTKASLVGAIVLAYKWVGICPQKFVGTQD
jgi:hypothetical protein